MIDELYEANENVAVETAEELTAVEMAWKYFLANKNKIRVAVQVSPAVRVAIGEWFGLDRGEDAMGKIVAALKLLGADVVVDSAIAEDVISMAEMEELKSRWEQGAALPVISSRCSAFVKYIKETHPEMSDYLLQSPSPMQTLSMLLKKHYDKQNDGKVTKVIALVPCSAKESELDMDENVRKATDLVLTTKDLVELFKQADFNLVLLEKQAMDLPFGISSGCGYIANVAGGVAETLLRSVSKDKSDETVRKIMYSGVRGWENMREAEIDVDGRCVKVAVACGLDVAEKVLSDVASGNADYDFVEVVACEGGCVGGDAQPYDDPMTLRLRALGLWYIDSRRAARSPEICPSVASLYNAYSRLRWEKESVDPEVDLTPEVVECTPVLEEVIEETVEEPVVEEVIEETVEEPVVEEVIEETVEEPVVEEVIEEKVEEPVVEEVIEETVEEPVVEDEIVEVVDEVVVEDEIVEVVDEVVIEDEIVEVVDEVVVEDEIIEEVDEVVVEDEIVEVVDEVVVEDEIVEELDEVVVEDEIVEELDEVVVEDEIIEEVDEVVVEDEIVEVVDEVIVEEVVEEPVVEEVIEETVEEPVVEEVIEETVEEPVAEESIVEEAVEEPVVEEPIIEEVAVAETVVEETDEDVDEDVDDENLTEEEKRNPYYRRLSRKERRKLKRMRRFEKSSK